MTWTLNATGHVDAPEDELEGRRSTLIDAVREAVRGLPDRPSSARLVWSHGEDQRNIDLLSDEAEPA